MQLDLAGGKLDQVESMWGRTQRGRTCHGEKPAATSKTHPDCQNNLLTKART